LQAIPGGAAARPFIIITHSTFHCTCVLKWVVLKRLIVGGFDGVLWVF
jgi:lysyl-tRNA synthetase class II